MRTLILPASAAVAFVVCVVGFLTTIGATIPPGLLWAVGIVAFGVTAWSLIRDEFERRADERTVARDRARLAPEALRPTRGNEGRLP
jgi:xanthine/uracil permease